MNRLLLTKPRSGHPAGLSEEELYLLDDLVDARANEQLADRIVKGETQIASQPFDF